MSKVTPILGYMFVSICLVLVSFNARSDVSEPNAKSSDISQVLNIGINNAIPNLLRFDSNRLVGDYGENFQCIIENLNAKYRLFPVPAARLEILLERGNIDLAVMLTATEDRDSYGLFSDTVFDASFVLLTKKVSLPVDNNFSGWTIGTVRGTSFEDLIVSELKATAYGTGSWSSAVIMLNNDRLDGVYLADVMTTRDIDASLQEGLKKFVMKRDLVGVYVGKIAKNSQALLNKVNASIRSCRKE